MLSRCPLLIRPCHRNFEVHEMYITVDINKDGYIDIQDLQEMLQSLNEDISMEDIALMMNDIESDIPGRITFEEFAKRIVTRYKEKQETKSTLTNALKV